MRWETNRDGHIWRQGVPDDSRSMTDLKKQNSYGAVRIRGIDRYGMPEEPIEHSAMWRAGICGKESKTDRGSNWMLHQDPPAGERLYAVEGSRFTDKSETLSHHGVPGMHWGEITKEYVPKGYYKQRTLTATQNRKKQKQKNAVSPQYESAKAAGRRVGDAFFAENRQRERERRQQAYEAAHPKEKGPDLVDKATKKAFDHFSLGAYSQLASNFIKDTATNKAVEYFKSKSGQVIKVGGKYAGNIGKVISKPVSLAGKGIIAGGHGLERLAKMGIKKAPKGLVQAGKFIGKAGKSSLKGLAKVSKWYRGHRSDIRNNLMAGRSFIRRLANTGHHISRLTGSSIQSGARLVQTGAKSLANILRKVKRFH